MKGVERWINPTFHALVTILIPQIYLLYSNEMEAYTSTGSFEPVAEDEECGPFLMYSN